MQLTQIKAYGLMMLMALQLTACQQDASLTDAQINEGWNFWQDDDSLQAVLVDLPHDAQQQLPYDSLAPEGHHTGYARPGVFHYRKVVSVSEQQLSRHLTLQFESVYRNARLLVNGSEAAHQDYGYLPLEASLDGLLHAGSNTLEVIADNSQTPNSRWYTGAGIYRPVHLLDQAAEAYLTDVRIRTTAIAPEAHVCVETKHQGGEVSIEVLHDGNIVASAQGDLCDIVVPEAQLWSAEHPELYTMHVQLHHEGQVVEVRDVRFGIRQITWNAAEGLLVNGQPTLLRGGCLHHDNGVLGACEYDDAIRRKVARLKEFGYNAIRSAHNPCSEAMLRVCDEMGMYVMDELWDMWYIAKTKYDYSLQWREDWRTDVAAIVRKDYSHPSVIMYSIGNENNEPSNAEGYSTEGQIVEALHQLDQTRPVTAGLNLVILLMNAWGIGADAAQPAAEKPAEEAEPMSSEQYNQMMQEQGRKMMQAVLSPALDVLSDPACDQLDIVGYNYGQMRYAYDNKRRPDRLIVGSETMSYNVPEAWPMIEQTPQLVGDFQWTAWDYLGECGIGMWYNTEEKVDMQGDRPYPWKLADTGAFDLLGNAGGEAYWCRATWLKDDVPYICVCPVRDGTLVKAMWRGTNALPLWSWPGQEGKPARVEVYTSAPRVELWLGDELLGEQQVDHYRATFDVTYQPGTLRAVSISSDGSRHEQTLTSAIGAPHISVHPEQETCQVGDLIFVDVNLEGENGVVIPNRDQQLTVECEGGRLLGYGSARRWTTERFIEGRYTTQDGRSLAVIQARKAGPLTLTVKGEGLEAVKCVIDIK